MQFGAKLAVQRHCHVEQKFPQRNIYSRWPQEPGGERKEL